MRENVSESARTRGLLAGIFVLALLVRAGVGFMARGHGEMENLADVYQEEAYALAAGYGTVRPLEQAPKEVDLFRLADSLAARGERITPQTAPPITPSRWRPATLHPPGYAVFLWGVYRLLGEPLIPKAKVVQAVLDAAAALLVYLIGRRFTGRAVGLVAATAQALSAPAAYLATSRVADSLCPALYILVFWLSLKAVESRRVLWFAAVGAALGLLCLFRPDYYAYAVFFALTAWLVLRRPLLVAGRTLVVAAGLFLVVLPWGLRNQRALGTFKLTSVGGPATLYESIGQFPNPYGIIFDDAFIIRMARDAGFEGMDDLGAERFFRQRYLRILREDPALIAGQMARRIPIAVAPLYRWGYVNPDYRGHTFYDYVARERLSAVQAVRRHPLQVLRAYWDRMISAAIALGLFVACVGLCVAERRRWRAVVLLLLPYWAIVVSHLLFNMGARLLAPALFCQLVVAAYWIVRLRGRQHVELWAPR